MQSNSRAKTSKIKPEISNLFFFCFFLPNISPCPTMPKGRWCKNTQRGVDRLRREKWEHKSGMKRASTFHSTPLGRLQLLSNGKECVRGRCGAGAGQVRPIGSGPGITAHDVTAASGGPMLALTLAGHTPDHTVVGDTPRPTAH